MKYHPIIYWSSTVAISAMMLMAAGSYLTHSPKMVEAFTHLGYPLYFMMILGVAKILGAIALLVPRQPRLKEWAYAGFTFTFIGAVISHLQSGDGAMAIAPAVSLVILACSCLTRPASRTFGINIPVKTNDWRPDFAPSRRVVHPKVEPA